MLILYLKIQCGISQIWCYYIYLVILATHQFPDVTPNNTHLSLYKCIEHPLVLINIDLWLSSSHLDNSANVDKAHTLHFNRNWNHPTCSNGCNWHWYYIWFRSWLRQGYFWHSHHLYPPPSFCTLVVLSSQNTYTHIIINVQLILIISTPHPTV
jgi:hypothetical protein